MEEINYLRTEIYNQGGKSTSFQEQLQREIGPSKVRNYYLAGGWGGVAS